MTTTTITTTTGARRGLAAVLLSRRGSVYLNSPSPAAHTSTPTVDSLAGISLLEADLIERGFLLSADLRQALSGRTEDQLVTAGHDLLADIDAALGADRDHTPLFRRFPDSTPADTLAFYVDRVLTVLLQKAEQPCVLCGSNDTVHPVAPCAHLVCTSCFDGADFSACPICHRRIDVDDPFLRPQNYRPTAGTRRALPDRLRVLTYGGALTDRTTDAKTELTGLLARTGALSPQDTDDLSTLLDAAGDRSDLAWLPESIPGRATKALVLAWLLEEPDHHQVVLPAVISRITTATDVLRLAAVRSGGDAGLLTPTRFTALSRPLRRAMLQALDGLDVTLAAEDMRRHEQAWKHLAERLHPFEHATRYPNAALTFAALRKTTLTDDALSHTLRTTARRVPTASTNRPKVALALWSTQVETALAEADVRRALPLLAQRPGELLRRLDHMLRLADSDHAARVLDALEQAVPQVAPGVILSALGEIRTRSRKGAERVFFPKGGNAKAHIISDQRAPLAGTVVDRAVAILTGEILRRAGRLAPVDTAVLDAGLDGLMVPFAERTASRALVTLPRGSELPLPDGRTVRLFLHWMESTGSGRTDLDLSAAMFNDSWEHVGTCDYTRLRFAGTAAVHSGDLTSAPAPQGASEFVDLDLDKLAAAGVRYLVAVVFSFNNVAFDDLADAFAGFMARDEDGNTGAVFDPRQVEQRFDLTGQSRASVPLLIDVKGRTMRWLDVVKGVTGTNHAVHRHANDLATLGEGLTGLFTSGARVGLGELATWQAAGRARTVVVRHLDGSTTTYRRRPQETTETFATRIGTPNADDALNLDATDVHLAYLVRGDLALADGGEAYALYPAGLDARNVHLLGASDLVATLTPQ
ncbi:MXAN_6230/SCO0854 family RING domain-containing protein [Streptomyces sp. NBC_00239]|uniref:MXAN_6230/SCO0854 family RING domain-containing protein n=1 Tax=Streptomyces sp. NBC_00239 TaxID=2903640 RepID=UPI002E28517F|nr:MXAN_6230/SCO0854 family RING domain-containing protein [Streptomyces sp. NBC_00239]